MELRHIRYFLAVAEEGSFTKAAARVGIGQPPLSLQIKDLEAEVGALLFHRLPHGAELTEAGRAFRDAVAAMPGQAEEAIRLARRASRGELGSLGLGCIASAAVNPIVSTAIRGFRRAYPDVELRLEESSSAVLAAGLREGRLGAAVIRPNRADARDLRLHLIAEDALVAALPAGHELAAQTGPLALATLANETFVITAREIGAGLYDTVVEACRQAGFEPRFGQPAPQIATLLALVAAEFGVALFPASMRQLSVAGVVFRSLERPAPKVPLTVAVLREERSELVRNFVLQAAPRPRRCAPAGEARPQARPMRRGRGSARSVAMKSRAAAGASGPLK
ncbi:LysR family transcriptional regulator [Chenggangzhangella methanolivorans]|uniref:LysR family transcriptional regulator n=1 Tax=Chenggangzhangella methanolivorans TaxID=1437009 RepID=A0A9E6RBR8_9HYPH|nr:LysR family transcriptional regulator [Chenggangzhangella methanolivorans]QZO01435.1 LysR family transcriptional regulator [Chenggangzhangella methanolivorans]